VVVVGVVEVKAHHCPCFVLVPTHQSCHLAVEILAAFSLYQ
jgi:hypothetical protein